MAKYQPVKLTFDLSDDFQLQIYNHLKKRSNGSAYIRTLIYNDMTKEDKVIIQKENVIIEKEPEIVEYEDKVEEEKKDDMIMDGLF